MTVTQRHFKTREVQFKHYRKVFEVLISTVIAKKKMAGFQAKNAVQVWTKQTYFV